MESQNLRARRGKSEIMPLIEIEASALLHACPIRSNQQKNGLKECSSYLFAKNYYLLLGIRDVMMGTSRSRKLWSSREYYYKLPVVVERDEQHTARPFR